MSDILIVGAGPTGLTLACELAVRGAPYRLMDALERPFPGSRAKGVQPRTLEVFDRLGIVEEIVAAGHADMPYRQYTADGSYHDVPRPGLGPRPDVPWPSPVLIPQWRTEAALRGRLEFLGGKVEYGATLVEVEIGADLVRAKVKSADKAESIEARWLVGCDGGKSVVRHAAGLKFLGETHEDMRMLVGDMHVEGIDREHWHTWRPAAGGFLSMAPLPGTDAFQVQIAIGPKSPDSPTLETFQALLERYTGRIDFRLSAPTWMSLWRANVRMVDHYRAGRLFVAGDAAHVHTPAGGQGMNTGIQDAFNLGWKLAAVQQGADPALLDSYEAERLPVARGVLELSTRLASTAVSGSTQGLVARDEGTFQLGIHYRESALSRELRNAPGAVRAGDRAPDATGLVGRDGRSRRLFEVIRGPQATLLAFGTDGLQVLETALGAAGAAVRAVCIVGAQLQPAGDGGIEMFTDSAGQAAAAWEPGAAALFVIRPDGVVGLAADRPDSASIIDWLRLAGLCR